MSASRAVPSLANSLVVGVTGHRKLRSADIPGIAARVRAFLTGLQQRFPGLPLVLLSPLAEGSDRVVTQVALDMGLRVIAPLPLPIDLYRDDFDQADSREALEHQLRQAEVLELPLAPGSTHASVATPGPARDLQYAHAGMFVSHHCHVLLALWDGEVSRQFGGTAHAVAFHLRGTMSGQVARGSTVATLLGPDCENVVYHLPVARHGDPAPADATGRWLIDVEGIQESPALPAEFAQMLVRQAAYERDVHKYAAQIAGQPAASPEAQRCPVWHSFRAADWLARTYQKRVSRVLMATYLLVALMGFTFFGYTDVQSSDLVLYAFLAFFLVGLAVTAFARRYEWQRKYLDYRTLAEGLRVQSCWRRAGIVTPGATLFAQENFLQKQDVELGWIRNVMRSASLDGLLVPVTAGLEQVDAVVREWIGTPDAGGQLAYYPAASQRRSRLHHRAETLGRICIGLGVGLSVLLVLMSRRFDDELKRTLVSAMGFLSVAAAVQEAYMHKKADKEMIRQYRFMQRIFASAQRRLDATTTVEEKRLILVALGEAALTEHAEWSLMHRERPLPQSRI